MKRIAPLFLTALLVASCATAPVHKSQCLSEHPEFTKVQSKVAVLCNRNGLDPSRIQICIIENLDIFAAIDTEDCIIVSTGLLTLTPTPGFYYTTEAVLAHELSHYALNHLAKQNALAVGTSIAFTVANIFIPGIAYADYVVNPSVTRAFSRSQELDADVHSVKMCRNAGIPDAAKHVLQTLEYLKARYSQSGEGGLWSTHPAWDDRISAVKEAYAVP